MVSPTKTNQVFFKIKRPFSAEGFHKLDILEALREVGCSNMEAKRLFANGAIKVWDTRPTDDKNRWEWFQRRANAFELMELPAHDKGSVLIFGRHKILEILPTAVPIWRRLFWSTRPIIERFMERIQDRIREWNNG